MRRISREEKQNFNSNLAFVVDVSGSGSDEENARPWENEHTMTISDTPEKVKKRQQRKTKTTKKSSILQEEENEDDEETKVYKQRLRNVSQLDHYILTVDVRDMAPVVHRYLNSFSATTQTLQRRRTENETNIDRMSSFDIRHLDILLT